MQNVSAADFAKVTALQKISLHCYIDGTALEAPVSSCEYSASVGTEDSFSFGNACAASVSLVVAAPLPGLVGKDIRVTWSVDETEYPLLVGSVEKTTVAAGRTTVEAYDWMYRKGGQPFDASELQETCSAGDVLQKVAALMEVALEPDTLTDAANVTVTDGLKDIAEDTNCAQIAGYVAGLMGKNALMSRGGLLTAQGYSNTDFKTEPYSGGAEAQSKDFGVSGITLQRQTVATVTNPDRTISEEQVTLDYSAGDGSLMVDNPLADQDAADRAYAALATLNYRPGSYSFPGGLLLEPGDLFSVQSMDGTYTAAAVALNMTIDGGCMTVAAAGGEVTSGGFSGSINQALAAVQVALARFQKVYADNAVITAANIETLRSGKIYSNSVELIPADTSGEADTLGKLVLWGYGAVGTELVEKLVLEVYPYDENNVTPAVVRVPNALNIVQGDTALLMDLSVNSMQVRPQIDAQGGLKAYEDLDADTGGIMVFNSGNGVTKISTGGSKFTGSIVVDGNYTTEIGDTTKLPPDTYYNGTILPQAFAPAGLGAGYHNSVYRGQYLGSAVTDAQWEAIATGNFTDLYIGDYWTIGGINYRIAAFDYYYKTGDTSCTTHHVVIVPDTNMYMHCMNDTNVTTGAYVGSKMYTKGLDTAKTTINSAFGSAHILNHRQYLQNATTSSYASAGSWYDSTVELMTEQNVYGCKIFGNCINGTAVPNNYTVDKSQYPLFAHRPDMISNSQWFWLRDVASAASCCVVNLYGNATYSNSSYASGVRPAFSIC